MDITRGWLVRTKAEGGAEAKTRYATYQEAVLARDEALASGYYKCIWIDENSIVPRKWSDLVPTRKPFTDFDRKHVTEVEEDD